MMNDEPRWLRVPVQMFPPVAVAVDPPCSRQSGLDGSVSFICAFCAQDQPVLSWK
jgi:hypothetical protein